MEDKFDHTRTGFPCALQAIKTVLNETLESATQRNIRELRKITVLANLHKSPQTSYMSDHHQISF
jgi:hypothetical protein